MQRFIDDEALRLAFSIHQQPGVYALLLGSGLSSAAGIKTGWGITIDLIRRVGALRGEKAERTDAEWEIWYREQTGRAPDYSELLVELGRLPAERQPIIASYIEPTEAEQSEGLKLPTQAHHAIARLVAGGSIRVILTTNFDQLLETALREAGVQPVIIATPDQCNGAKPLQHVPAGRCTIIKLHGDYLDVRSLNTVDELATYDAAIETLLARVFDEYGLVICGWSGVWDTALRNAIVRAPGRRYSTWWASLGPLAAQAQDLARHRDSQLVTIDGADGFFCRLAEQVELIDKLRQKQPETIPLMIARAKRYLADPSKHRIDLHDHIEAACGRIVQAMGSDDFNGGSSFNKEVFRLQVARYEALCGPLMALVGTTGRWGNAPAGETDVLEAILRLSRPSDRHQDTRYNMIRTYPAVLAFTAYGLGLTQAGRWQAAWALFDAKRKRKHQEPLRLVEDVFLSTWGPEHQLTSPLFCSLEGLEQKRFPLAMRLRSVFKQVGPLFLGTGTDIDEVMDRYEFNGTIAYCRQYKVEDLEGMRNRQWRNEILHPYSQGVWDGLAREQQIAEAKRLAEEGGGFVPKDPTWVTLFGEALEETARYWRMKSRG
jgi:hypothetical protein